MTTDLMTDLSPDELDELDAWLASPGLVDSSMDVAALEGFLAALAIGPRTVPPSDWLPWVWDMFDGRISPDFDSVEDANHVLTLVMRLHNGVLRRFMDDPDGFEPVFLDGADRTVFDWCDGFMFGTQFNTEEWDALLAEQPDWFNPFIHLGTEEGLEITEKENDAERWTAEVVPSLLHIHDQWRKQRQDQPSALVDEDFMLGGDRQPIVRETAKVGRNDPCPCGSGKKYKKCCGADAPAAT